MTAVTLFAGYDPGGDDAHGVALLETDGDRIKRIETKTLETAEEVITYLSGKGSLRAIGVDTLTCWSTGPSGWRPADRWLRARERYSSVRNSVMSPNSLSGSMGLNGVAVLVALRQLFPDVVVTETHPKVIYWHFYNQRHDYPRNAKGMCDALGERLGLDLQTHSEHEWDAAISADIAHKAATGAWTFDLHQLPVLPQERLISPCGKTHYYWPDQE